MLLQLQSSPSCKYLIINFFFFLLPSLVPIAALCLFLEKIGIFSSVCVFFFKNLLSSKGTDFFVLTVVGDWFCLFVEVLHRRRRRFLNAPPMGVVTPSTNQRPSWFSPIWHWPSGLLLTALVLIGMVTVWRMDGSIVRNYIEARRSPRYDIPSSSNLSQAVQNSTFSSLFIPPSSSQNHTNSTLFVPDEPVPSENSTLVSEIIDKNPIQNLVEKSPGWIFSELEPNLTSSLLARWLAPGGHPCRDSYTTQIAIPGLDNTKEIELPAGEVHEFTFQALDESGNPRCLGGDYFETDLSGERWKSRPVVRDFGNGTYSISLQVHPDFEGLYNLTIILLYRHFEGLKFTPWKFVYDRMLRNIPVRFIRSSVDLPELQTCRASDFTRDVWSGRWTRLGKNDDCEISDDGRFRCLAPEFPCKSPWCDGSLGNLESNGWVYSTHCSFKLFSADSAWNCLKNRWIFFWGDSNHVDTIRNMLNFILDLPEVHTVPRRFDMNFSNPKDPSQTVRITSIFNGHWNETKNYEGLNSLINKGFQDLLKKYFLEPTIPDTMIINSGLHDGVHWTSIRSFSKGAQYAASFWEQVMNSVKQRGLARPRVFYRSTVATGGYARSLAYNPSKMEVFNGILLEKLKQSGVISGVIDNFDMTYPWHFDNRCNDGVHYGRAPLKMKWRDGQIGHQYFVDLMLAHVLLNAICAT